ncbi:MAG TPA: 2-oxoglutarate dehydrogenase E1 component [Steroidobacteraceae bacterium]|nr:2-oxoglutarate dehydrogenase E1 component [Steroidobacteraceae bacterium]
MSRSLRELIESSPFASSQAPFVEALYDRYLDAPGSLDPAWRQFFEKLGAESSRQPRVTPAAHPGIRRTTVVAAASGAATEKQSAVSRLIQFYANRGHLIADIDPLALMSRPVPKVLDPAYVRLTEADLDSEFHTGSRSSGVEKQMKLRDILRQLRHVYGGRIGAEFAHVTTSDERLWLQDRFQEGRLQHTFSRDERLNLLWQLSVAEGLERYLHTKYVGQKRFSLEGADALIPLLDDVIQRAGSQGVEELVIGMAHRGRLNVLVNVLGKPPSMLFSEFEGQVDLDSLKGSGDVKYHKGFSADLRTPGGNVHVVLAFNPSHLEVVNAVVEGSVRARQDRRGDAAWDRVVPLLVHGDAAFAGQGVVMETLQLSQARGFATGGTLHVIVNNQVGFTTSEPADARSTLYCSDVAKMIEAPIFHVNADDPEAVVFAARLALDYRTKFHKDVVIDLVCYRRHGHNEADEPAATQPLMYQAIRRHPTARQIYGRQLEQDGLLDEGQAAQMAEDYRRGLDEGRPQARAFAGTSGNRYTVDWTRHLSADWSEAPATGVAPERLRALAAQLTTVPAGFMLHPRVARVVEDRRRMYADEAPLDWGAAETLAYATLLADGVHVRLCGQDSARGTFFHRHAVWHDQSSGRTHLPLAQVAAGKARLDVIDSVLSEEAVLGFEYGYSTTDPEALVIWEGQFGDFANGAQVIIDQFIASGEAKWGRLSGITLFLPHGYEGQGPEHSSARLERFLQLCAELNMQVCVPSTPAQMFHLLRRQMLRSLRKPLVVMTPKSLLRHKQSSSTMPDLASGHFHPVIDELDAIDSAGVRRLVVCSGKVYYDLLDRRHADQATDVALARIEQLYPFPADEFHAVVTRYPDARQVVWCQEEPQNQGAWYQVRHRLQAGLLAGQELLYAGREGAAAPATGIHVLHQREQENLVAAALYSPDTETTHRETHRLTVASRRKGS